MFQQAEVRKASREAGAEPPRDIRPGLRFVRRFTRPGHDALEAVTWTRRDVTITGDDGEVVFSAKDVEVPASWGEVAVQTVVSKYFRREGVPGTGRETSVRQVISRMVSTWRHWGEELGYFANKADAEAFQDELSHMIVTQRAAPNSPQWFNMGLAHVYGIRGAPQGHYYIDDTTGKLRQSSSAFDRPQVHACFIQSCSDDLLHSGGILDLVQREARLFKYGSGSGTNFSAIRGAGEPLSGGGTSSGLMSFLKIFDAAAGAIKSGGTTRRAAKMVCLDVDHPDIEAFVRWKADEERKARILIEHGGYPADFNGEAYATVGGQNSNNTVRVSEEFLRAVERTGDWPLIRRTDGEVARVIPAAKLWEEIRTAAHSCADPGIQYVTTINDWHTCPEHGAINASNPCSEYLFLDSTACNLASINLARFVRSDVVRGRFEVQDFVHAVRLWTTVLDISNSMAQYPSAEIAEKTHDFRTIGLGFCGLGAALQRAAIAYDSEWGRNICSALSALMTGVAYETSAELARELGPYPAFDANREHHLRVVRNHRRLPT